MPGLKGTTRANVGRSEFRGVKAILTGETTDRAAPSLWNHNEHGGPAPHWGPAD
jgi:hypothetical protein